MGDPRFKSIEIKVGIFVLFAVAVLITIIIAVGISRDIFVTKTYIYVYTETGDDVSKGMPVKYSGFAISRVDSVTLQDDGRVVMSIGIPNRYIKWIRKDSVFKLGAQNIIGSNFVTITTNLQSKSPTITSGDHFTLIRDQGIQAIIDKAMPVIEDLKEIVSNINTILGRVADENGDVTKLLKGLGALGDDISNKEGSLGFLVRTDYVENEIVKFLKDLRSFSEKAVRVARNVEEGSLTLNDALNKIDDKSTPILSGAQNTVQEIEDMAKILKPAIERLNEITIHLEKASKNAADGTENLDALRSEIQSIVETGNELLLKIENTWPLSIGSEKPKQAPLQ